MKGRGKEAVVKYVKEDEEEEGQRTGNKNSGEGNDELKEIESGKKLTRERNTTLDIYILKARLFRTTWHYI